MKIREGAYYRTRGGDVVGPMRHGDPGSSYPWISLTRCWTFEGKVFVNVKECNMDLISEVYVSDTPPDAPSDDMIVRMNFSEMARKGCKTNSGNVHFFCGMDYIQAHYSIILHWKEGVSPPVPPAPPDTPAPEEKTLRDEFAMRLMDRDAFIVGYKYEAEQLYRAADAMMEARKK